MDKLTGQQSNLWIIPIVGMGGIGKTTLARNVYAKPLIMQHFDIRAWVTVSQNYNVEDILIEILLCISKDESLESLSAKSEGELGERIHKTLWGRRYLIVLDDIWSAEAWDKVNLFFPENGQRSRIMMTTRLSDVASIGSHGIVMDFLNEEKSWDLLCRYVFEEEDDCPPELEEIGKKIAKNCEGLPLSIVVIGGHLAKSERTREHWEYISENTNTIVNSEDNERCLKALQLSYNLLPVHLKPCFLYMGVFPEGNMIRVSWLVKLWVSEGFVKPINCKSLEVVSREYLQELCDRNLILVHKRGSNGNIKYCKIHDLLRDLCLREAEREKFLYVRRPHEPTIPRVINTQRRIGIHQSMSEKDYHPDPVLRTLQYVPLVRSLICNFEERLPLLDFRLLRVLKADDKKSYIDNSRQNEYSVDVVFRLVNLRFIAIRSDRPKSTGFPSSVNLLWNLQTLIVNCNWSVVAPCEIWNMTQLKHVHFYGLELPDPPIAEKDDEFILGNLQTLSIIRNFKCGEDVIKRIPNITKLQIFYFEEPQGFLSYCLDNLGHLHKLESLRFSIYSENKPSLNDMVQNFILPNSLKKLTLMGTNRGEHGRVWAGFYKKSTRPAIGGLQN
ncbi:PREDICTED: putative late blight resistance protein homolog R1B-17 [Erythranthe guttata]|uniref:putative late blight resistance protein homolog R1B-17 n=1 Tax=Erythranthe guttata TaxID=4155 RepID=UPI00064E02E2|nr:PREDICTED: putative late blight resistance protein homolog R1B-17 [Erythranthe guttata]|eukprot:XP_012844379.1 PREDICTED: putative late blight resistance protein homolog R1B-17 [Erythranthe guttata]